MGDIRILDACCGSRMFWFDKNESHTTFMDIRQEKFEIHGKKVNVNPDALERDLLKKKNKELRKKVEELEDE